MHTVMQWGGVQMFSLSMSAIISELLPPALLMGGGAIACVYLEKKERPGLAAFVKIGVVGAFILFWLLPMVDRLFYLFTGALSLPLGIN
jgi:hypothetical protein